MSVDEASSRGQLSYRRASNNANGRRSILAWAFVKAPFVQPSRDVDSEAHLRVRS